MAFLQEEDYKVQIRDFELEQLTGYTDGIRLKSETAAQAEMESYLRDRYRVEDIFSEAGDERNPLIVMYLIDMALYHLFSAITPRQVPSIRMDRYDAAINWLKAVASGKINPNLPLREDDNGNSIGTTIMGSNKPNRFTW